CWWYRQTWWKTRRKDGPVVSQTEPSRRARASYPDRIFLPTNSGQQNGPQVWIPPQTVGPPQVIPVHEVGPAQVWIPPQCVGPPQVTPMQTVGAPHVWTPPKSVAPP